ncbi:hypothetical protein OG21DRAFT_785028 [Imleria badia]|nr:hypothetical protein OG21DRAFT_785028 [Imleria badia]
MSTVPQARGRMFMTSFLTVSSLRTRLQPPTASINGTGLTRRKHSVHCPPFPYSPVVHPTSTMVALSYASEDAYSRHCRRMRKVAMFRPRAQLQGARTSLPRACLAICDRIVNDEHWDRVRIAAREVAKRSTTVASSRRLAAKSVVVYKFFSELSCHHNLFFVSSERYEHLASASRYLHRSFWDPPETWQMGTPQNWFHVVVSSVLAPVDIAYVRCAIETQ